MPGPQPVDDLVAAAAAADTVFDSAVTFINGVPQLIADAVAKAIANGATADQLVPVSQVATDITNKAAAIQAAIVANTSTPTVAAAKQA